MNVISDLLTENIKNFSMKIGADFVGIASPDRFTEAPKGHRPADLMKSVKSVIVCGKVVPNGAFLAPGTLYHNVIKMVHLQLDQIAIKITQEIENKGGTAVPIPTHAPYYYWDEERQYGRGDLSIKHAAEFAGLGKIGKSTIFISPDHGILTRLVCILTDLDLEPSPLMNWEPCPEDCRLCIDACPTNAIKLGYVCEQALCRKNIFKKTLRGDQFENCRECIKACPWLFKKTKKNEKIGFPSESSIGNIEKKTSGREKVVISTLGPTGTCSEFASYFFIKKNDYHGEVNLCPTFEDAVSALMEGKSDYVIIPSAYRNFSDIIFAQQEDIEIVDVFKLATPSLVIASLGDDKDIMKVATHTSPSILAKNYFPNVELVIAKSNSNAAEMLLAKEVDACVTTIKCVEMYSLNIVHEFGNIAMGWNVLKRKSDRDK